MRARIWALRSLHWLAFPWVGIVFVWGVTDAITMSRDRHYLIPLGLFTALMVAHVALYALNITRVVAAARWWRWLYIPGQATLVVAVGLVSQNALLTFLLVLALIVEAAATGMRLRATAAAIVAYLLCFALGIAVLGGASVASVAVIYTFPIAAAAVGYVALLRYQIHTRERALLLVQELETAHRELKASAARVEELTLMTERQRMARELHDTLAQGLAGLVLQLEAIGLQLQGNHPDRAQAIVQQAQARARAALADARGAIDALRAQAGNVAADVQDEIDRFTGATGIPCESDLAALALVPLELHEHLVRAVAEGLANVAQHARASQVWVHARPCGELVAIEVRDDGIGFDPAAPAPAGHYGLLGLRERARLAGGTFAITSAAGEGTAMRLSLPAHQPEAAHA